MVGGSDPFDRWQREKDVQTRHLGGRRPGSDVTMVWLGGVIFVIALVAWVVSSF